MVRFKHRLLKLFRVGAALVFFLLISFFFLDFTGLFPAKLIKGSLGIQFIPSALLFSRQMALSAAGFSLVILITLLFGRLYCSSICPLGILQDFILRISQKGGEKRFRYHPSVKGLRHFVLLITLLTLFTGNVLVLGLLGA